MKVLKKALAVAMSLSLCVSMVAPAFAATFTDLQNAISNIGGTDLQNGRYGYGESENEDGSKTYGVEAWDEGSTRKVQLNEDVTYDEGDSSASIKIGNSQSVELDLNGNSIECSGSAPVIAIAGGNPGLKDSDPGSTQAPGELTLTNSGETGGTISGGEIGVKVEGGASLTIEDGVEFEDNGDCDVELEYVPEGEMAPPSAADSNGDRVGKGATLTKGGETIDSADAGETVRLTFASASDDEAEDTMTGAEFVNYIWEHEGRPTPVDGSSEPSGQKYAAAIAWARSIGLVDDEVQLDELMTVSKMRAILTRLAAWKGIEMPELAALTGKEEDPVRNCLEVLEEFFGED